MKYKLTDECIGHGAIKLYRIQALRDFGDVKSGDLGGWISSQDNLGQDGDAWVCGDAKVYGNARVYGDAWVCGNAEVSKDDDFIIISSLGAEKRTLTAFKTKDNDIEYKTGCFHGDENAFRQTIVDTHGDNDYAKSYLLAIQLAKSVIKLET